MQEYKLNSWSFQFDRAKRRFGCCNFTKKQISLSRTLTELNSEKIVKETILHEIAHALAGRSHGHDKKWKGIAVSLGCTPRSTYSANVKTPLMKYTATCPSCESTFQTQRKKTAACSSCCKKHNNGKYSKKFELIFSENPKFKKRSVKRSK